MKRRKKSPHYRVRVRLAPSKLHGIGVFAIKDIKKGTRIFYGDDADLVWIDRKKLKGLPVEIRKMYQDFCVFRGDLVGCPKNFNQMTPAWYLNSSKTPNVRCDKNYDFFTSRDIKEGEELLVDYDTYSDE